MDNKNNFNSSSNSNSVSIPQNNFSPQPDAPKPKGHKALIIILTILVIASLTAAGIFAYLYFTNNASTETTETSQTGTNIPEPEPTGEETEIIDTYILRDLDEKIAILHNITEKDTSFAVSTYNYGVVNPLYTDGTISDIAKLSHVVNSIQPNYYLSYDDQVSIANELGWGDPATDITEGVKSEDVATKYLDVFGEKLTKGNLSNHYCPGVHYNAEHDFYYLDHRCGGTSPLIAYIYKNKYTADANHAYVYISVATLNGGDGKVYCDYMDDYYNLPTACGETSDPSKFTVNEENYQDFAQYRFVFKQADDGTYYFEKVEKL